LAVDFGRGEIPVLIRHFYEMFLQEIRLGQANEIDNGKVVIKKYL